MHKDHLVSIGIFKKIIADTLLRGSQHYMQVIIDEHRDPAVQVILDRFDPEPFERTVLQHFLLGYFRRYIYRLFGFDDLRGWMYMIQQRIVIGKAFRRKKLL